jgi:hypothetical protein
VGKSKGTESRFNHHPQTDDVARRAKTNRRCSESALGQMAEGAKSEVRGSSSLTALCSARSPDVPRLTLDVFSRSIKPQRIRRFRHLKRFKIILVEVLLSAVGARKHKHIAFTHARVRADAVVSRRGDQGNATTVLADDAHRNSHGRREEVGRECNTVRLLLLSDKRAS